MKMTTNLAGLKKLAWKKNLRGYFTHGGRELSDAEVRRVVEYGISKGYRTEADIPEDEVERLLDGQGDTKPASITYDYGNGRISHYALKKVNGSCRQNGARTVNIGVFCKGCGHYNGMKGDYVVCTHPLHSDDAGASDIRDRINRTIMHHALCALDD